MVTRDDALKIFDRRLRDNFAVARLMSYSSDRTAIFWFDSAMNETVRTIAQCTVGYDPLTEDDILMMNGKIYDNLDFLREEQAGMYTKYEEKEN